MNAKAFQGAVTTPSAKVDGFIGPKRDTSTTASYGTHVLTTTTLRRKGPVRAVSWTTGDTFSSASEPVNARVFLCFAAQLFHWSLRPATPRSHVRKSRTRCDATDSD
jgi:hypothetical protein